MNPSLTMDLLRFIKAKPMNKKIMAIRIGGNVNTFKTLKTFFNKRSLLSN